jgi:hypothetical protein
MSTIPSSYRKEITDALKVECDANKLKVALFKSTHTPLVSQVHYNDIIAQECSGTNYNAGGNLLSGATSTIVGDNARFAANATVFTNVTVSASYAVVYNIDTGHIRGQYTLSGEHVVVAGTLTLTWNASGVIQVM